MYAPTSSQHARGFAKAVRYLEAKHNDDAVYVAKFNLVDEGPPVYWQIKNCLLIVDACGRWRQAERYRALAERLWDWLNMWVLPTDQAAMAELRGHLDRCEASQQDQWGGDGGDEWWADYAFDPDEDDDGEMIADVQKTLRDPMAELEAVRGVAPQVAEPGVAATDPKDHVENTHSKPAQSKESTTATAVSGYARPGPRGSTLSTMMDDEDVETVQCPVCGDELFSQPVCDAHILGIHRYSVSAQIVRTSQQQRVVRREEERGWLRGRLEEERKANAIQIDLAIYLVSRFEARNQEIEERLAEIR